MSAERFRIRDGHPRVLIAPDDLPILRRRAATTHAAQMQSLLALAARLSSPKSDATTRSATDTTPSVRPESGSGGDYADPVWRLAFLHLLTSDPAHANAAIFLLRKLLDLPVSGEYFVGARRLKALAACYDWLHASLDDELRQRVGRTALDYCQALYDSGEVEPDCFFLGHAINQMPFILMAAIAVGDELDNGTRSRHFIADVLARWQKQMPCYRRFLEADCFQQSMSYTCTYVGEFPYLFNAIEAGLSIEMYRSHAWFANVTKWWTYGMRDDASFLRFGDYFCAIPALENAQYFRALSSVATRYRDGLARWWTNRFKLSGFEPDEILFEERADAVDRAPPEDLPRTKLFGPMGLAVARGDFDVTPAAGGTVAAFKCTPIYLHNHGHRDANSFTIYHKAELAIDSGAYDAYETPHWYNYYVRTVAHNTIVIHDPDEQFNSRGAVYANDGGQRFINEPHFQARTCEELDLDVFQDGKIIAYREGEDWSYVCGDASNCYTKQKLTKFLRHVTFVLDWPSERCVSMLVLDEIELPPDRPKLEPRFLLHTMDQPRVDGATIVARHGAGRLTAHVLLPKPPRIELIGGPGCEFEVDGKNYPLKRQLGPAYTPGSWRAEVTVAQPPSAVSSQADPQPRAIVPHRFRRFLTLLVPADADAPPEPPATVDQSAAGYIVRQGDLAVVLSRPGQPRSSVRAKRVVEVELAHLAAPG